MNECEKESLWGKKVKEIMEYCDETLSKNYSTKLTKIYEKYRNVVSEQPGKLKNFQGHLQIKENLVFNKSHTLYPSHKSQSEE